MIGTCTRCSVLFETSEEDACTPGVLCRRCHADRHGLSGHRFNPNPPPAGSPPVSQTRPRRGGVFNTNGPAPVNREPAPTPAPPPAVSQTKLHRRVSKVTPAAIPTGHVIAGLDDGTLVIMHAERPDLIAEIPYSGSQYEPTQLAYAQLFAAAPEMFAACNVALYALNCNPKFRENQPVISALRAAIARAQGDASSHDATEDKEAQQ